MHAKLGVGSRMRGVRAGGEGLACEGSEMGWAWLRRPWAVAGPGRASSRRAELPNSDPAPQVWRAPEGPEGLAAVPVGGGGAWPGFETTRRAQLAARTASGRAAVHGHTKQPGPPAHHAAPGTPVGPQETPAFTASQQHAEKSYEKYASFIGSS